MKYPRTVRMVFQLAHGVTIESADIIFKNDDAESEWGHVLRDPKNAGHYAVPVVNVLGNEDSVFINPTYVMAIRIIDVKEDF